MPMPPAHTLSSLVVASLHDLGLCWERLGPVHAASLWSGGWYTLPDGERVMAVLATDGRWRLQRFVSTHVVRPTDGALLRCLDALAASPAVALIDFTTGDLEPDAWVPRAGAAG